MYNLSIKIVKDLEIRNKGLSCSGRLKNFQYLIAEDKFESIALDEKAEDQNLCHCLLVIDMMKTK